MIDTIWINVKCITLREKSEIRSFFNTTQKISSKWIRDINVKLGTRKLLKRKQAEQYLF